jgi:hypothetical protein
MHVSAESSRDSLSTCAEVFFFIWRSRSSWPVPGEKENVRVCADFFLGAPRVRGCRVSGGGGG